MSNDRACTRRGAFIVSLALLTAPLLSAGAQSVLVSAPIQDVHYDVTADSAAVAGRQLGVTMTFRVASTKPVILSLPAWSPGHYALLWFSRRVSHFEPQSNGAMLAWHMVDYQTWEIQPKAPGQIKVSFDYLADTIDRAVAWTKPDFSFFNGTNIFMYPVGRDFGWGASVTIHTEPSWNVATGMNPEAAARTYSARNYHDLVDMPFFVGRFAIDSTRVSNKWVRLAMYPTTSMTSARKDRILGWVQKFVPQEVAVFRDIEWHNYTIFLVSDSVVNAGGLEHQDSQMDEIQTDRLDANLAGMFAHEFFHSWNVKRLRPADMVPYKYNDTDPTKFLWVSEGLTSYYSDVARVRSGIIDSAGFYSLIAATIAATDQVGPISLSDASLSVWVDPTDGTSGIYYTKGALAGFLLDIMIRDASNNAGSLDLVMRNLYNSTYKKGRGFTNSDWWGAVRSAAGGRSFDEFRRRYIDGREPMPVDSLLALAGLQVKRVTSGRREVVTISEMPGASAKAVRVRNGIMHAQETGATR